MAANARMLRIGGLSARTHRSVHTIRWYESQGLIPGVMRDPAGRRVYSERHVGWLELIERLRLTGMSIAQMREYTALVRQGKSSIKQQHAMLSAHRTRVRETIAAWNEALEILDRKVDFFDEWLATGVRPARQPEHGAGQTPKSRAPARTSRATQKKNRASAAPRSA